MRKFVAAIALILAFAVVPAWAAMTDSLQWVDSIPGLKLTSTKVKHDEVQKQYTMKSKQPYNQVIQSLKGKGWTVMRKKSNDECPDMPKVYMVKDGQVLKIDVDREHDFEGAYYELELELEQQNDF